MAKILTQQSLLCLICFVNYKININMFYFLMGYGTSSNLPFFPVNLILVETRKSLELQENYKSESKQLTCGLDYS